MKKVKTLFLIILGIIFLILAGLFFIGYFRPKSSGLNVYANEESSVYVDGQLVGKTPFQKTIEAKEIHIKIVPSKGTNSFESNLTLTPGVETVVRRDFDETNISSGGETVSFEKTSLKEASVAIVSIPDKAQITIDGQILGFAPLQIETLKAGEHTVNVGIPGYEDRNLTIRTYSGYKLTAVVELKKATVVENIPEPIKKVQILSTPNGFLRVRENPSTESAELFQIQPGMTFNYEEEKPNWIKIEYKEGIFGWISSQYAEVIENSN